MGNSSFFNNPNDYQTVDEGGEGSGFYDGPAYTEIDPVAIANSVAAAAASATASEVSHQGAVTSAAEALASKNTAVSAATLAVEGATTATDQATIATTQAGIATTKASQASTSETNAATSATTANSQAIIATTKAGEAATSATNAATSETNAASSEANAATSEANAATSASNAATAVQAAAGTATPVMDGTAAVGVATKWARQDHVHPTDTSRADAAATTSALALKAPLASPAFTGTPTAPTPTAGDNSTKVSTTAFVAAAIAALVASSPSTLDTLNELAAALGNDPNFATTMATALGLKAPLASPALTGTPTAPTPSVGDNSTKIATTAFVQANAGSSRIPDAIIEDQKASGTSGGGLTAGLNTRTLNTLVRNVPGRGVNSLSGNQFELLAGTYYIQWSAPAWQTNQHQALLRNVTDGSYAGFGTSEYGSAAGGDGSATRSFGSAIVPIAATKSFTLHHLVATTRSSNGAGLASGSGGVEVYSRVEITKIA